MNEILKAIKERRSIRKFKAEMPKKTDLEQIIEAGLYAANGMGKQSTAIIAVTNKELRDRLSEMNRKIGGWGEILTETCRKPQQEKTAVCSGRNKRKSK